MYNIIGDIAGNYKTLMALIEKMPEGEIISVGDMVDRGPRSKEVVQYFMKNGRAILGNHEHMMIDHVEKQGFYGHDIWIYNGGGPTLKSYDYFVPPSHIKWMKTLPKFIELEVENQKILVSHAFLRPSMAEDSAVLKEVCEFGNTIFSKGESTIIWNRSKPVRREKWDMQICGHNSQYSLREWRDEEGLFAMSIDTSREEKLTGLHLPSMKIYQQDYID